MANSNYLTWWYISDKYTEETRNFEHMMKLLAHASRLKCDVIRPRGLPTSTCKCGFLSFRNYAPHCYAMSRV